MKKSKRNVFLLGLVSLFNDFGSEMIFPILPILLASMGETGLVIGLIGGLRDGIASVLKLLFGYLSDKKNKRKVFVISGYFTSSISKILLSLSTFWTHILIFTSLDRIGKGMRDSPRDVIISESMKKHRGEGFGIQRSLDTLGAVLGSFSVLLLIWYLNLSFKKIIFIAGLISLLSLLPLIFVKDIKTKNKLNFSIKNVYLSRKIKKFFIVSSIFALANFSYMFFILKSKASFSGKYEIIIPIILYIIFNIVYSSFAFPFGKIADKIGKTKVLSLGYFFFFLVNLGFLFLTSVYHYIFLFILYGLVFAVIQGNQFAYVSELADKKSKGTTIGLFHAIIGITAIISGLITGLLWDYSRNSIFIFSAILSLISFTMILKK
ncbi:MFS transporter [Candidatus Woesearchaeota archaeon]|nr:MFS transporter [Candidatus Woesearchaeota archaeon]